MHESIALPRILAILAILACLVAPPAFAQPPASTPPTRASRPPVAPVLAPSPALAPGTAEAARSVRAPFADWLEGVRTEALARGIGADTVTRALDGVAPVPQILERDRTQAEFALTTTQYLERRLTRAMLRTARQAAERHRALLDRVHETYKVQTRVLVAVWGLESNFGRFVGVRPMIPTLATLAYEPRRAAFFRQQLFDALVVVDKGYIELSRLNGSWAGAMGQPQFMPSSYLTYAQDFDGDGRRDIWTSHADVFASIAYYLQSRAWNGEETWGRRVDVPAAARAAIAEAAPLRSSGCRAERQMSVPLPLDAWRRLGVRRADRQPLPAAEIAASLLETDDDRAYLVYGNYEALLAYNCAHTYALSVSLLSDAIDGIAPLPTASSRARAKTGTSGKAGKAAATKGKASGTRVAKPKVSPRSTRKAPAKTPAKVSPNVSPKKPAPAAARRPQ